MPLTCTNSQCRWMFGPFRTRTETIARSCCSGEVAHWRSRRAPCVLASPPPLTRSLLHVAAFQGRYAAHAVRDGTGPRRPQRHAPTPQGACPCGRARVLHGQRLGCVSCAAGYKLLAMYDARRQAAAPPRRACLCAFLSPSYLSIPWRRSSKGLRAQPASACAPAPGPSRFFFALAHRARTHRCSSLNLARTLARSPAPACCYPRCGRCWMEDIFWCC